MTLQLKILLSYLALGGGAGGIYLGTNGGFGNSAMEGIVEISEPTGTAELVVAKPPVEEPTVPVEKPQDVEVQLTEEKEEISVKGEITPEEKAEEVLTSDEATEQTEISNSNEDTEPKPVIELQVAEEAPAPQSQELKVDIASPTPKETKASVGTDSIKETLSKQPTPKTEQKDDKSSLEPEETQCPDQSSQKGGGAFFEAMSPFSTGQYGMEWIKCYAKHMHDKNKN